MAATDDASGRLATQTLMLVLAVPPPRPMYVFGLSLACKVFLTVEVSSVVDNTGQASNDLDLASSASEYEEG